MQHAESSVGHVSRSLVGSGSNCRVHDVGTDKI